jgi:hypothetical protein
LNPMDVAQYGIGFFAIACLVFIAFMVVKPSNKAPSSTSSYIDQLSMVIENNTLAISELAKVNTSILLAITRQGIQQEEILARLRGLQNKS